MKSTLVIADLHLSANTPEINACFYQFLKDNAGKHEALYILGDLFEVWFSDRDPEPVNASVARAIREFSATTPVYYIHGNRDFMLGRHYAKKANMTLLPEELSVDLYGRKCLLMHGDQLCIDDVDYQKFRKKSRSWWWKLIVGSLPFSVKQNMAKNIRQRSKEAQNYKSLEIMDVNQQEVERVMADRKIDYLIHGHTHRPAIHQLPNNKQRCVVGDWYTQGSVLQITPENIELSTLTFNS